jgi:hypothetical protein
LSRRQTAVIPDSTRLKGRTPFLASPPALRTQPLVGIRFLATQRETSTLLPARGRCFSIPQTTHGFGAAALLFNTTGINNTAVGATALLHNTIAEENTATGAFALSGNTEGDFNTANGAFALWVNTTE